MPGNPPFGQFKTDQTPFRPLLFLDFEQRPVDEVVAVDRLRNPAEAGLDRRSRIVDVVPVKAETHLQAQRIAGTETDILQTVLRARTPQSIPQPGSVLRRHINFTPSGAGIARRGKNRIPDAGHLGLYERIIFEILDPFRTQPLHDPHRQRPLHGKLRDLVRSVVKLPPGPHFEFFALCDQVRPVFADVRRIDHQQKCPGVDPVNQNVVHDSPATVRQTGILYLPVTQRADVVRRNVLQEFRGAGPFDPDLPHMAHIENARPFADGAVFVVDPGKFDRHAVAGEFGHPGAILNMIAGKRSGFHRSVALFLRKYANLS